MQAHDIVRQAIALVHGARIVRAPRPVHGKASSIHHGGAGLFRALPSPFLAGRYHSLVIQRNTVPDCLEITAETDDGTVMGLGNANIALEPRLKMLSRQIGRAHV